MVIGRLDAIRRYPVKSLSPERLDAVEVAAGGIPGDRAEAFFVRGGSSSVALSREGKPYRGKDNDRLHRIGDTNAARASAAEHGADVELREGEHFFDDAPVSILIDRWLDDLSAHAGYQVEWQRFRPNFFVRAAEGFAQSESGLVGTVLQLGSVTMRATSPNARCVVVTYHPERPENDPEILRYIAQHRENIMGIYCEVLQPGVARVGDELKTNERGVA
ncbi:MAG TPA: MOSC domain-containing protein [Candidatus Binatia bacterium]|nr:MOSC domain-containing protein [Candidatus Binatia bacterium]